jgi:hypothetical protein
VFVTPPNTQHFCIVKGSSNLKAKTMNTNKTRLLIMMVLAAWSNGITFGQNPLVVYPGDITNNGVVNNLDFLYLGLAYNYAGPARDSSSQNFEALPANPWSFQFPGGLNMAYADCNGDGFVNYYFDAFPLYTHYGLQRDSNVVQDVFVPGLAGVDPPLRFDTSALPPLVQEGQTFSVPIELGMPELPADDLYGIAFSMTLSPAVFDLNQIKFNFSESSWANPDNDRIWMSKKVASDRIDVAWVRTDRNQKTGFGKIGFTDFVIIVDVVGLQQSYPVVIDHIKMMDKYGNYSTVAGDTMWVNLAPDALLASDNLKQEPEVEIFPNPAQESLNIRASENIQSTTLIDMLGQAVLEEHWRPGTSVDLHLPKLPNGIYLLRIDTDQGVVFRRVQIQR